MATALTELTARGFQGVSDFHLIDRRLQGAARKAHERKARNGSRKPQSDGQPDWHADALNSDRNAKHAPVEVLLQLQALRRMLHEHTMRGPNEVAAAE